MKVAWRRVAAIGTLLIVFVVVAACETTVSRPIFADLTYAHLPQLQFDVARVEVVEEYRSPLTAPNVEHNFPTTLSAAVRRWSDDRLRAVGETGVVRVKIEDASAIVEALKANDDVEGLFTTEQAEKVRANVVVSVEILDERNVPRGYATAEATRSRTIPEDVTLNERDEIYFQVTQALMNDFNASQEQAIRQYLGRYLR